MGDLNYPQSLTGDRSLSDSLCQTKLLFLFLLEHLVHTVNEFCGHDAEREFEGAGVRGNIPEATLGDDFACREAWMLHEQFRGMFCT